MRVLTARLAVLVSLVAGPALAADDTIRIEDGFARSGAQSGAAFFVMTNTGTRDDRLVGVSFDGAGRSELHTHVEDANGVMKMREIEGGIALPAGATHVLGRGGDHVMFMGLDAPFEEGETISLTLEFETAGPIVVVVPVDNARRN